MALWLWLRRLWRLLVWSVFVALREQGQIFTLGQSFVVPDLLTQSCYQSSQRSRERFRLSCHGHFNYWQLSSDVHINRLAFVYKNVYKDAAPRYGQA